jgi:amidophosphoribosyltransferase
MVVLNTLTKEKNMCGIIGIIGSPNAALESYQGLLLMQHRGQDAAGILSFDSTDKSFHLQKAPGLVDKVFNEQNLKSLKGQMSIGHTRYSTIGRSLDKDIQPLLVNFPFGMGLAHNGNLLNVHELKTYLKEIRHRYIFTNNDAEILLNLIADGLGNYGRAGKKENNDFSFSLETLINAINDVFEYCQGGFAVVSQIANQGLLAFRDPNGIRPLILGERDLTLEERQTAQHRSPKSYCFASESNILNFLGYNVVRDVMPGEMIFIELATGKLTSRQLTDKAQKSCMFEYVYFANPESVIDEKNVYASRLKMGEYLGHKISNMMKQNQISPDVVIPVPETSRVSAIALSEIIKVPYRELLIKNRYVQRSFILNSQKCRENAVMLKLSPIKSEIQGKKVLIVDDSIVRGTTSKRIIDLVKNAGAKEVYFASACPPVIKPCFYGIDFPNSDELIAYDKSLVEVTDILGANAVIYLDQTDLMKSLEGDKLCMACIDGNYPVDITSAQNFKQNRVEQVEDHYVIN